jgi:hypothetical protein
VTQTNPDGALDAIPFHGGVADLEGFVWVVFGGSTGAGRCETDGGVFVFDDGCEEAGDG